MRGPRPLRLFLMGILALTPVAQTFWFAQAWHVIDAVAWPGLRALVQGLWIAAAVVVLAAVLDLLRVRALPPQVWGPWDGRWPASGSLRPVAVLWPSPWWAASTGSRGSRSQPSRRRTPCMSSRRGIPSSGM